MDHPAADDPADRPDAEAVDAAGGPSPLRVGLVGAGPWARMVHGPMFARHPGTVLAGIWARRAEAAAQLAAALDTAAVNELDDLLERCDAVAFCVPPDVQADLASRAAAAGKALLLEKPIALDVSAAERLADTVQEAGVGTQIMLSWRYAAAFRALLDDVAPSPAIAGRAQFVNGAMRGGPFATPWRLRHGPLFDLGPHVIDALDALLGPVVDVRAHGRADRWVGLLLAHAGGAFSEASLSATVAPDAGQAGIEVYTAETRLALDTTGVFDEAAITTVVDEFVTTARHGGHPLDVHHGLRIQRIIARAHDDLVR